MKNRLIAVSLVLTACLVGIAYGAVVPGQTASPLVCADAQNAVTVSVGPAGETVVTFAERATTYRDDTKCGAVANVGVSSGAFVGDYVAAGIVALKFKFKTDGHTPAEFTPRLYSGGQVWRIDGLAKPSDDQWTQYTIGMDTFADGWVRTLPRGADRAAIWAAALQDVSAIGVFIKPEDSTDGQVFMIKDFMLVDASGNEFRSILTPLADALWKRFGKERIADVDGGLDADQDGVSDLNEVLVGTDADDDTDRFIAQVVELVDTAEAQGARIRWESAVEWAVYDVYRSANLTDGFVKVSGNGLTLADVDAVENTSTWLDESADPAGGPYFYKVIATIQE